MKKRELVGKRFGRLKVIASNGKNTFDQYSWVCRCDCGKEKIESTSHLTTGFVKSCGCLSKPHGESHTSFHNVWCGMLKRCTLKSRKDFHRYGGRGIKVCKRWNVYLNFREDMFQSHQEAKEKNNKIFLDRINNDGNYNKRNCRWVNSKESMDNRSSTRWITFDGRKQTLSDWARELNITATTLCDRLEKWSIKDSLTKTKYLHLKKKYGS